MRWLRAFVEDPAFLGTSGPVLPQLLPACLKGSFHSALSSRIESTIGSVNLSHCLSFKFPCQAFENDQIFLKCNALLLLNLVVESHSFKTLRHLDLLYLLDGVLYTRRQSCLAKPHCNVGGCSHINGVGYHSP